ncbi:hypothetical protein [Stenotrophomonas sp. 24(2023)]|uniref:hypothetical protein n=1 Tax=Stenotrophomonas sp. 24(2023) TaxID=3068324 RepID=UPI0027DFDF45|nr:hypothetical protein [Stenotrophomonas sp. 24(2023)]WMJ67738.1 hypothetical protein Q9R17_10935 [Stenotrophomonas sp. 24(2023)]
MAGNRPSVLAVIVRPLLVALLCAAVLLLGGCAAATDPALRVDGGCTPEHSPFLSPDPAVTGRITFCEGDDGWTGTITSGSYPPGTQHVEVMLAGYPTTPGVTVSAVGSDGQARFDFSTHQPRERWERVQLEIPADIARSGFYLQIDDRSTEKFGWAGFGASNITASAAFTRHALPMLLAIVVGNAWLLALSLCLPGPRRPALERLLQGMLAAGCLWLLIFIAYVRSPQLGSTTALLVLALPFPAAALLARRRQGPVMADIAGLQKALLPVLALSLLVLWIGLYPFTWNGHPNGDPALRWPHLSTDAWLPLMFGEMLARGALDVPMVGDWLSSDRPPLQVGTYLLVRALVPGSHELVYQGISTWAQALVLLPLAALLGRFMGRRAQAIALFTLCLSPLMLLNTLYVWPKLLAAAFSLIFFIALFPPRGAPRQWGLAGIASAMALLSHGGSLFFLVGAALTSLAWHRRQSFMLLLRSAPVALALYLPWVAYQKFIDPPGDRLIKWHFGGQVPISSEGALQTIANAYRHVTPWDWLCARIDNLAIVFKGTFTGPLDAVRITYLHDATTWKQFIDNDFFHTFHSLWFASPLLLIPCLAVLYARGRRVRMPVPVLPSLLQMVITTALFILVWTTAIFEGGTTTINTGAYAGQLMLQLAVLAAAWCTRSALFYVICSANIVVAATAYVLDRHLLPGQQAFYLLGAVLFAGGLLLSLIAATQETDRNHALA